MENLKDSSVLSWFTWQANLANSFLSNLKGRDGLVAEWKQPDKLQPPHINGRKYEAGKIIIVRPCPAKR